MAKCKITVVKRSINQELIDEYLRKTGQDVGRCTAFEDGQEFTVEYLAERPEDFRCDWAWDDIHKVLLALMLKGDFSTWMKDGNTFITCCTDGIKPVVFKIERIDE